MASMDNSTVKKCADLFQRSNALTKLLAGIHDEQSEFWLVGGCLRDLLLDHLVSDIDIVSSSDPTSFAKHWASEVHGRWFWLDAERLHSRVLLNHQIQVDFSPLRAESIITDLELRDFTVNSLALSLSSDLSHSKLVDPLGGQIDLLHRRLRESSHHSFLDDPLRMLKGIRHAVTLNFNLSSVTSKNIKKYCTEICSVAGERIRDELFRILLSNAPVRGLELLHETGLLQALLDSPKAFFIWSDVQAELTVFHQTLKTLQQRNEISPSEESRVDLSAHFPLFLFVKFLQLYQPIEISDLLHHRLKFSRYEQQFVQQLISQEEETKTLFPLFESEQNQRRKALIVELLGPFSLEKLLYWGVCHGRLSYQKVMNFYQAFQKEQKLGRVPDLINGREFIGIASGLKGSAIGFWQKKVKYAEISGEISTFDEAAKWLKIKLLFDKKEV